MSITIEQVKNIARLAKLELTAAEEEKYRSQLEEVIDYNVAKLSLVETDGVEPLWNASGITNALRSDESEPGLTQEEVLQNTKSKHNGFFKVKAILE